MPSYHKLRPLLLGHVLAGMALLAGCVSPTEQQAMTEIVNFYGGRVEFKKGAKFSTEGDGLNGKYLEIQLRSPRISRRYDELALPASNCAYLAYHSLHPDERGKYDYYKVEVSDSAASHTYTFRAADMAQADHAYQLTSDVLTDLQQHNYLHAVNACNPAAFASLSSDTLLARFAGISRYLAPFEAFTIQGFETETHKIDRQQHQLTSLIATVPGTKQHPLHQTLVIVDPRLKPTEKFLYGIKARE